MNVMVLSLIYMKKNWHLNKTHSPRFAHQWANVCPSAPCPLIIFANPSQSSIVTPSLLTSSSCISFFSSSLFTRTRIRFVNISYVPPLTTLDNTCNRKDLSFLKRDTCSGVGRKTEASIFLTGLGAQQDEPWEWEWPWEWLWLCPLLWLWLCDDDLAMAGRSLDVEAPVSVSSIVERWWLGREKSY